MRSGSDTEEIASSIGTCISFLMLASRVLIVLSQTEGQCDSSSEVSFGVKRRREATSVLDKSSILRFLCDTITEGPKAEDVEEEEEEERFWGLSSQNSWFFVSGRRGASVSFSSVPSLPVEEEEDADDDDDEEDEPMTPIAATGLRVPVRENDCREGQFIRRGWIEERANE